MSPDRLTRREFLAFGVATAATALTQPYERLRYQTYPKIIFAGQQKKDDPYDIFLFNPTTNQLTNLTNTPKVNEMNPDVSKNGNRIIYYSDQRDENNDIYILNLAQSDRPVLMVASRWHEYDPTFSPLSKDGQDFAYKFDPNKNGDRGDIYIRINNQEKNLTGHLGLKEEYKPAFSPDGKTIYFTRRQIQGEPNSDQIYKINIDGTEEKFLANGWYPAVNPINGKVSFVYKDRIFVMNADGGNTHILPGQPPEGDNNDPAWSLDGNQIIFINNATGTYKLHTINADGSGGKQIDVLGITGHILSPIFAD